MLSPVASVTLELKYCQACGGLWLRLAGSDLIHCPACTRRLASQAPPRFPARDAEGRRP